MIKIILILIAVIAIERYNVKDITSFIKEEGGHFMAGINAEKSIKKAKDTVISATKSERKNGGYRLKASRS